MNRDALLYIALSAFLLIIGKLTGRYILKKVYASAGVTQSNVLAYRASVAGSPATARRLTAWLLRASPSPGKTRRLLAAYYLAVIPGLAAFGFSLTALFLKVLTPALLYVFAVFGAITLLCAAFALADRIKTRRRRIVNNSY